MDSNQVFFDTKKIQKLGRILLSEALLRNAGLQEGDAIDIYFDAASKHIIIKKAEVTPPPQPPSKSRNPKGSEHD